MGTGGGASPPLAIPPDIEWRGGSGSGEIKGREVERGEIEVKRTWGRGEDRNAIPNIAKPHSHLVCMSQSLSVRLYRDRNERGRSLTNTPSM